MEPDSVKVLVLNQSFEPLHVCSSRRAILLLFAGKAELVEESDRLIRSPSKAFPLPSVIRLHRYVRRPPMAAVAFNKKNILRRDGYTCQYCGRNGGERMTIDHIVPRSLGGRMVWENVVTSCQTCNGRKANKTLREAGMRLLQRPTRPFSIFYLGILANASHRTKVWSKYLTKEAKVHGTEA